MRASLILPTLFLPLLGSCVIAIGNEGKANGFAQSDVDAAVAVLHGAGDGGARGIVRFEEEGDGVQVVAEIEGLKPGTYTLALHESGDAQELGSGVAGPVLRGSSDDDFDAYSRRGRTARLGAHTVAGDGRLAFDQELDGFHLGGGSSVLGRSVVIRAGGNSGGEIVAYGVIGAVRD